MDSISKIGNFESYQKASEEPQLNPLSKTFKKSSLPHTVLRIPKLANLALIELKSVQCSRQEILDSDRKRSLEENYVIDKLLLLNHIMYYSKRQ